MNTIPGINNANGLWEGSIQLGFWNTFFSECGEIGLNIGGDMIVEEINVFHQEGFRYVVNNQDTILDSILSELLSAYPQMQLEYDYDADEKSKYMPTIHKKEDFNNILLPQKVYIMDITKSNIPYIGYQFSCSWDKEHGFGVMMQGNRVVKMGGAETSFLSWIAEEDLRTCIQ